jgi:hypothetical protein
MIRAQMTKVAIITGLSVGAWAAVILTGMAAANFIQTLW